MTALFLWNLSIIYYEGWCKIDLGSYKYCIFPSSVLCQISFIVLQSTTSLWDNKLSIRYADVNYGQHVSFLPRNLSYSGVTSIDLYLTCLLLQFSWKISLSHTQIHMKDTSRWLMVTIWRRCPSICLFLVDLIISLIDKLLHSFCFILMKIGAVNGGIMLHYRLPQIQYARATSRDYHMLQDQ